MCEMHAGGRRGWIGWRGFPAMASGRPLGPWQDLSHRLHNDLPVPHVFPKPTYKRVMSMPRDKLNLTHIDMVCHIGTHVDAPLHLFTDGPGFDEIPGEMLHGAGVVWSLDVKPFEEIDVDMLQAREPAMSDGDIVLLHTGWSDRFGRDDYMSNPSLTIDAARWLVARGVKVLGVDFATPDAALEKRKPDFDWPVHQVLLANGALVVENLTNLAPLANQRVEVVIGALNVAGADGSPARILARAVESGEVAR